MLNRSQFGFLDFGIATDDSFDETISTVVRCAKMADELGFGRYWLGEHYGQGCCWHRPEIMMAHLASHTRTIQIGAGAALVKGREPETVAYEYSQLRRLFRDRIEIGLSGGVPADRLIVSDYPTAVMRVLPKLPQGLSVWQLGNSRRSLDLALRHKVGLCVGLFTSEPESSVVESCRSRSGGLRRLGVAIAGSLSGGPCNPHIEVIRNFHGIDEAIALIKRVVTDFAPDNILLLDLSTDLHARVEGIRSLGDLIAP